MMAIGGHLIHTIFPEAVAYKACKSLFKARICRLQHKIGSMCLQHSYIKVIPKWLKTPWVVSS